MCRRVHLRAHRASRRACLGHACLGHACLRHACLRHTYLRDARHATIVSSHVVSARVKRAAPLVPRRRHPACLPARYALRYRLRDRPRLLDPATLRPCDPVRLCTYAFSAPQEAAHTHGVPSQPSHPWLNPLSPSPSPHAPQKLATSQTLNYQGRRWPSPLYTTAPFAPHAVGPTCPCLHLHPC